MYYSSFFDVKLMNQVLKNSLQLNKMQGIINAHQNVFLPKTNLFRSA